MEMPQKSPKSPFTSALRGRRDPSSRHSMYIMRPDGPELSFADAVKSHDALLTSIYGSRSVDQHLTTAPATTKAEVSTLGNAGRPRSTVGFPPAAKSTTSSVWQPLFHHTTLVGSAAPLLATFKRDSHVQTEYEMRNDVGVQTEEAGIRPTAAHKRDVLVQTGEEWADLVSRAGDVTTGRNSETTPNVAGDTCFSDLLSGYPRGVSTTDEIYENVNQKDYTVPPFPPVVDGEILQLATSESLHPKVCDVKNITDSASPSQTVDSQIHSSDLEKDYVCLTPTCKSEVSYFLPNGPDTVEIHGWEVLRNVSEIPQECPSPKNFTTYEVIRLNGYSQSPGSHPEECENPPKPPVLSAQKNTDVTIISRRTLSPDKIKAKENRNSLNMDDYKYDRLSSCNTSERGSMISMLDVLYADSFKFESCENLDQLEEEIIRSLCTPVKELEEHSELPLKENCTAECFPATVPYSLDHMGGGPDSPAFFNNMSDQQKTEWHPDAKMSTLHMNCNFRSNEEIRCTDSPARISTPSSIDKRGMEARGEIIEKIIKGEVVDSCILNLDSTCSSRQKTASPQRSEENEIIVELLPTQMTSPLVLEVRRSSWSATNGPESKPKANGDASGVQNSRTESLKCDSPTSYPSEQFTSKCNVVREVDIIATGKPSFGDRPSYWPLKKDDEADSKVKNEVHINLYSSNDPKSSPRAECLFPAETNTEAIEKVKSCPPTPPPQPPPSTPPPPPPPPPPQCYQPTPPKTTGTSVDNSAKGKDSPSCVSYSKNPSPGSSSFFPSSQKDLMMQELTERFQRRQNDSINSLFLKPQNEDINHVGNNVPSKNNRVWSSTNGDHADYNGKDGVHSSSDYKNGIQYNSSHSSQELLSGQDVKHHQIENHGSGFPNAGQNNETPGYPSVDETKYTSPFPGNAIITDEPPPRGAILVDQKVIVEGDQVHTDKYYAVPVKEVLKEKTSTAKFTPAPPKYDGIGPTEDGVPTGLRQSVKKENMSNWYKTMFKSLHKAGHPHYGGYNSDPEFETEERAIITKCATLDTRQKPNDSSRQPINRLQHGYPPSAKSTVEVYNVHPRPIEDYEPGYSSVVDNEITTGSKRFLPALNHPKPSYEFKCGYESDTSIIKKLHQPEGPHPEQQKLWYREIQRGGDIPQYGLGKLAPEKPKVPVIGPAPSPSFQGSPVKPTYPQVTRPRTPPPEHVTNDSGVTDVSNGNYSAQMQHAIHTELQRRMSPSAQQVPSTVYKTSVKTPPKSPELKMLAKVLYDFVSESPRELNLKKEESVLVLRQLDKNWYEGEHKGSVGIFPVSYVEILPPEHVSPQMKQPLEGLAKAIYDFRAQTSVELPLKKGDTVTLIRRVDQNWYEGRIQDRKGIFPATYVQVVQEPGESRRSSLSPTTKPTDSPHRLKVQEDNVKKSPAICPTPPPSSYTSTQTGRTISSSPNASGRAKKGSSLVEPVLYRVLYGYSPQNADELELLEGDNVYVVEMCDDGWFVGTSVRTGVFGIFPGNYVEKV